MTLPTDVAQFTCELATSIRQAFGDNLAGIYLCGSLALGTFDPKTSDIDVLVVTERPISDTEFAALKALHERIPLKRDGAGRSTRSTTSTGQRSGASSPASNT